MRRVLLVLLLIPLVLAMARPRPTVRKMQIHKHRTTTAVWVIANWTAQGSPDGFTDTGAAGGQATQVHNLGIVAKDSFAFVPPTPGSTISGTFTVVAKRRGKISTPVSRNWTYTEPDVPPPPVQIDSIIVRPASFTIEPGGTAQMCAFVGFRSGHIGLRGAEQSVFYCTTEYQLLPASVRAVTALEKSIADTLCVAWKASGGTISTEACSGVPG